MLSERGRVALEDDLEYPKRPDSKMDFGELGGVAVNVDDCGLPGTLTRGYSKSSGLGGIVQACAVTGGNGTAAIVFVCCNVGCTGAFGSDLASRSRSRSAASLSCMMAIEEYGDSRKLSKLVELRVERLLYS